MKIRKLNPVTNGTRHQIVLEKHLLSKNNKIIKKTCIGLKHQNGRSKTTGRITIRHQGGGAKNLFGDINFLNYSYVALVIAILYDPKRSSFISLNYNFIDGTFFNTLATNFVTSGSLIVCKKELVDLQLGYRTTITNIPTGSIIHNLALF